MKPERPVMRYHRGKWRIAPWIISNFCAHDIYCEPYAGAASVFMRKSRVHGEVLNDIDRDIVNVFRVLRDPEAAAVLERMVRLTPFSREEFKASYDPTADPIERARRTLVRSFMGFSTTSIRKSRTGFRARTYQRNQTGPVDWRSWPDQITRFVERMQGVVIENLDAIDCIHLHDSPKTLFYVDPPYLKETRSSGLRGYRHEMTDDDHEKLLNVLRKIQGMVVISGYDNDMYNSILHGWVKQERFALADGGKKRTEVLWMNFQRQQTLFACR
ncbi:DNA adenine methylase [Thermodesulfobacteriota bacterium B35]